MGLKAYLCVCLCLTVGFSQAISGPDEFLRRYASKKVMETCLPRELVDMVQSTVQSVMDLCQYGNIRRRPGVDPFQRPNVFETPGIQNFGGNLLPMGFLPDNIFNIGSPGTTYVSNDLLGQAFGGRFKRQLTIASTRTNTQNFVQSLIRGEEAIRNKISNATCILRHLKLLDDNGVATLDFSLKFTAQLPNIADSVKTDIIRGAKDCEKVSRCIPPSRSSLIPFHLKQAYVLLKCAKLSNQLACVKKDIRDNIAKRIPNSVRGNFGVEDITQRMLEVLMAEDVSEFESLLVF